MQSFEECVQQHPRDVAVYRAQAAGKPCGDRAWAT